MKMSIIWLENLILLNLSKFINNGRIRGKIAPVFDFVLVPRSKVFKIYTGNASSSHIAAIMILSPGCNTAFEQQIGKYGTEFGNLQSGVLDQVGLTAEGVGLLLK